MLAVDIIINQLLRYNKNNFLHISKCLGGTIPTKLNNYIKIYNNMALIT